MSEQHMMIDIQRRDGVAGEVKRSRGIRRSRSLFERGKGAEPDLGTPKSFQASRQPASSLMK